MRNLSSLSLAVAAALSLNLCQPVFASETAAGLKGEVVNANGNPLGGVTIEIVHLPTGTVKTVTTSEGGQFQLRGLTVGGPYEVRVTGEHSASIEQVKNLFLQLGQTASVSLQEKQFEVIEVTGSMLLASSNKQGAASDFSEGDIANTAAISRDLKSVLARDSKIMVDPTVDGGPVLSIAGANVRMNSLTVDGVRQNDDFGLNKSGYPGRRSPISLDAIEQMSVSIAPYDVTYGSFQGGNINIVTKSGTNDFSGSAFYFHSNDDMVGDESKGQNIDIGAFDEDTYGFTLGGPIIEDQLFYFLSYEKFKASSPYPWQLGNADGTASPNEIDKVTAADYAQIAQIARDVYGYDIMDYYTSNPETDEKILAKFDWYFHEDHRLSFTYQKNKGNTVRDFWTNPAVNVAASLSNRYNMDEQLEAYSLQVFSEWSDDFSTEFKIGYKDVTTEQKAVGGDFAQMRITTPAGGALYIGPDQFRHANELDNQLTMLKAKGTYYLNDEHFLTFGYERDMLSIYNLFVFASKGAADYASIADFAAQQPSFFLYQNAVTSNPRDAVDEFDYHTDTIYFQDEWNATLDLTITYGLRYERYTNNDKPQFNQNFYDRHGYSNQENFDGLDLLSPRIGFNYQMNDRTIIRGGFGLFGGGIPNVWLSNSYGNDGVRKPLIPCLDFLGLCLGPNGVSPYASLTGFDGRTIPADLQALLGPSNANTNSIDPNFEIPSTWKTNLAIEYIADLGSLGDNWALSAELIYSQVKKAAIYKELNMQKVGEAPDGRPIYDVIDLFDLSLTNTDKGYGKVFSVGARKSWQLDSGDYKFEFGYTNQQIREVNPGNAFIAFEGYGQPAHYDYQKEMLFNSEFEVPHRVTMSFGWQGELLKDNRTSVDLLYTGRSGRHYSVTMDYPDTLFGGDGLSLMNGYNSQLLYIPSSIDDPIVTYGDAQTAAALDSYIDGIGCLRNARGGIIRRHACSSPWVNRVDLRLTQEWKVAEGHTLEFYFDIENFTNLINSDWGRAEQYPYWYVAPLVDVTIEHGKYVYSNFEEPAKEVSKIPSVWKMQLGFKYRF